MQLLLPLLLPLLFACGLAYHDRIRPLQPSQSQVQESYFRVNKMYTFKYDAQINIGVPDHSDQTSSSRLQAQVTLVKRSDDHFILRCRDIRVGKQLNPIQEPTRIQSFDQFQPNTVGPDEIATLELPVEFSYADGQIQDLVFQQDEQDWSANTKRGIINMLQIKLQPKDRDSMEEEQSALNKIDTESKTDVAQVYRTTEKTVEGECSTLYSVNSIRGQEDQSSSTLLVTKTVDLNSCTRRPKIKTNHQFMQQQPNYSHRTIDSSTVLHYQIRGKRDKFLVESVELSNDHMFTPQNKDENSVMVIVRASLRLTSSQEASHHSMAMSEFPQTGQRVSDLIYSTETEEQLVRFQTQGDSQFPRSLEKHPANEQNKVSLLGDIISRLMREMRPSINEKANSLFYEAVALVRMMKESELSAIHQQYFRQHQHSRRTPEEGEKVRNILPHIYAQAATLNTIRHLKEKISSGEIRPLKAAMVMPSLMNAAHVSKEMITEMLQLEQSSQVKQSPVLYKAVWLTIGSMMRSACYKSKTSSEQCSSDTKQLFVRMIADHLQSSSKWENKILFLRVLGNAGLDSSVEIIEDILSNKEKQYSSSIRMEAILALRHLRSTLPQKTLSILMATASNAIESSPVRMAAVQLLLQDNPGKLIIDQLISIINHDRNRRVASFTSQLVKSIAQSSQPCYAQLSRDLRTAIKRIRRPSASMPISDVIFASMHDDDKKIGADLFLLPFYDNEEIVPKFLRAGINQVTRGKRIKNLVALEMGTSGWSSIFSDFIQTSTTSSRQLGSVEYKLNLRHLSNKMRSSEWKSQQPKSWISLKFKDQDVFLYTLNEETLKQILQSSSSEMMLSIMSSMSSSISRNFNIDEATMLHESSTKIPTAIGSELRIKSKTPAILSIHGSTKSHGQLEVKGKLNAIISMVTDISSQSPIITSGIYLVRTAKASIPIDMEIQVDPRSEEEQVKIKINNSQASHDIIKLESRPVIYNKQSMKPMSERNEKTIVAERNGKMDSFRQCISIPSLGSEVCSRGLISKPSCSHSKFMHYLAPWFGPNKVVVSVESSSDREIKLSAGLRHTSSAQDQDSYKLTMQSGSQKQTIDMQISNSQDSIIPKQVKAHYRQWTQGEQQSEICMQLNSQRHSDSSDPRRMKMSAKVNWGATRCQPDNYVEAKVETVYRKSMYSDETGLESDKFVTARDETAGYKIQLKHSSLPKTIESLAQSLMDYVISTNYWNSQVSYDHQSQAGQETVQVMLRKGGKADIKIQTKSKTVQLESVQIPQPLRYEKLARSNLVRLAGIMASSYSRAMCQFKENTIQTFDNAIYKIPSSQCYTILAKDEASQFTVLAKQSASQPGKKTVKVITEEHEIMLKPQQAVYLDGSEWREGVFSDQRSIKISRSGKHVSVRLVKAGVVVSYDGNGVTIQVPEKNHGRQQGMCGNLNADSSDDFGHSFRSALEAMTIRDGSCQQGDSSSQLEQFDDDEGQQQQSWDEDSDQIFEEEEEQQQEEENSSPPFSSSRQQIDESMEPTRMHKIIKRGGERCVSIRSMEMCPDESYPAGEKRLERDVQYTCFSRGHSLFEKMAGRHQIAGPLPLSSGEISFSRAETVPTKCISVE